jgi:chorismate dehydratase
MAKLRISIVEYLNTAPLVWGFTDGPLEGKYDLSFSLPSQCAEDLRAGNVDIAIIPAIEYQRIENLVALPGIAIAAKGPVQSILLVAKKPIELSRRIALDTSSRSSAALVRLLAQERWGIEPEWINADPEPSEMLKRADAALVIGDPALRISLKWEALNSKTPGDGACCQGDIEDMPVPGHETLFIYDVAYQWRELTGKPCVLAIWAGRRDAITPEVAADFEASKKFGLSRIREIAEAAAIKLDLPASALERYLTKHIDFSLDPENLAGLRLYYEKAAAASLIAQARALEFLGAPATANESAASTAGRGR